MLHTAEGWWLAEARRHHDPPPRPPLRGAAVADVVVCGGGYLGLWTALTLAELEPGLDVVLLEADRCGHGPSGRNGGFVSTLWDDLPILVERFGAEAAVAVCRASEEDVHAIGTFCEREGIDAWYRAAGHLQVATTPAQVGAWSGLVAACRAAGAPEEAQPLTAAEVRRRCASPLFEAGCLQRTGATVHPARLALGLREVALRHGVRIHERTPVTAVDPDGTVTTADGRVRAGQVVLAVGPAVAGMPGHRGRIAVASSHVVVTEPMPDVLDELGWTGGEGIADCRTLLHYLRTTPDGRIVFGWGGGRMGVGARPARRLELDAAVVAHTADRLYACFPQARGRRIEHAWGGPIDVSPTHLPVVGSAGRIHHGYGFTGNGVGPTRLAARILARLALDRRDAVTRLALVDAPPGRFPPEPLRWAGGSAIRQALVRQDAAEDRGRRPGPLVRAAAGLPRRLGLHLPR